MLLLDTHFLEAQLSAYASGCADLRPGRFEATADVESVNLEARVRVGLALLESIEAFDDAWGDAVRAGKRFSENEAREIGRYYQTWLHSSQRVLDAIERHERADHHVKSSAEFRIACQKVRDLMSVPLDQVLRSIERGSSGSYRELGELRDELRGKIRG